jgi:phage baseplate assembly protein W
MTDLPLVPKLAFPFEVKTGRTEAAYHEQDSDEEVFDCVEVLLSTEIGEREEVPDYGVPDYVFREGGVDLEDLHAVIERWEPRALVVISEEEFKDHVDRIRVAVIEEDHHGS